LALLGVGPVPARALHNVTAELFGAEAWGTLAAFGDLNSDKQTDLFVLRERNDLIVFLADQNAPYFKPKVNVSLNNYSTLITSVVPGDYDGDSQMDVLLTYLPKNHASGELGAVIFWGQNQTLGEFVLKKKFFFFFFFRNLSWHPALTTRNKMRIPHSHAFIDLTEDFTAGELHINFLLADGDGNMDHLLPGCEDKNCQKSIIYLARSGAKQWIPVLQDFSSKGTLWGFVPFVHEQQPTEIPIPITLHIGDYNMDGYPDALAILKNTSGSNQQAFLLENVPCTNASCEGAHRMFKVYWELMDLNQIRDAVVATFFDIYEDGILDIVVLSKGYTKSDFAIHTLKNNFEADAYFVKPFGVNQPGPYIMYTTVDANGYLKNGSAGQLSQSAHLALQLPYNVLGLGRSANFLDHLYVGIPRPSGEKVIKMCNFNSSLFIYSWSAKLYLTPSNIVLLTAIALIGVCVFILAIIGILHWQEK
ncbi:hypothetical protein MJT46_019925, partial [Ovis ammon polii x Ovis aries]